MSKMIKCKHCGADIAASAKVCPSCGGKNKKPIYKKWWFYLLILMIIGGIVGGGSSNTTSTNSNGVTVVDTNKKVEQSADISQPSVNTEHTTYKLGDTIQSDNIELTVSKAEVWTKYNQYFGPSEGKEIYRVYMEVKNLGKNDLYVTAPECYADDEKCDQYYYADDTFILDTISTGRKKTGWLYYEVPKGATDIELEYQTSYWFSEYIIYKVK